MWRRCMIAGSDGRLLLFEATYQETVQLRFDSPDDAVFLPRALALFGR
jgi:hypothetical protein